MDRAFTYKAFIKYLRTRFGYTIRFARELAKDCREGRPVGDSNLNGQATNWYYRSDRKYEEFAV